MVISRDFAVNNSSKFTLWIIVQNQPCLELVSMVWLKKEAVQSTSNCRQKEEKPPQPCSRLLFIKLAIWFNDLTAIQSLDSSWITIQQLSEEKSKVAQRNIVLQLHMAQHWKKRKNHTNLDSTLTLATPSLHNTLVFYLKRGKQTLRLELSWQYWPVPAG